MELIQELNEISEHLTHSRLHSFLQERLEGTEAELYQDARGISVIHCPGKGERVCVVIEPVFRELIISGSKGETLLFSNLGTTDIMTLLGSIVCLDDGRFGIIETNKPVSKELKEEELFIDLGSMELSVIDKYVKQNSFAYLKNPIFPLESDKNVLSGPNLSSVILLYLTLSLIKSVKSTDKDLYFTISPKTTAAPLCINEIAERIQPNSLLAVSGIRCSESVRLDGGPCFILKDNNSVASVQQKELILSAAKGESIPVQAVVSRETVCNLEAFGTAGQGFHCIGLAVPVKYLGAKNEISNLKDVEKTLKLLLKTLTVL